MVKVKAVKPVFYNGWKHEGDEFECDEKHVDRLEKAGKIKVLNKSTTNKKEVK